MMVLLAHGQRQVTLERHPLAERWPPLDTLLLSLARTACTSGITALILMRLVQSELGTACIADLLLEGTARASPCSP